ncbi:MAG: phosphate ABC transporter permease PstA [Candidatus Thermoplasmatota archaeon]|nr:phosphate ABC transporter permease PstA [Candidatus Thermoplasmatota archaeon]
MTDTGTIEIKWNSQSWRDAKDKIVMVMGYLVLGTMFLVLGLILEYVTSGALSHISWQVLTTSDTFYQGGGIYQAIVGTWMLVGVGLLLSVPPGIIGSLYIVGIAPSTRLTSVLRVFTDVLTSVPSIVIGLFGYFALVTYLGWNFSLMAGGFALSVMMLPYILRVSELSMKSIPREQVQSAYALGADDIQVAGRIYIPQALAGIMSGILLAISIAAGETAQLLYTAEWSTGLPTGLFNSPVGYLSYVVYQGENYGTYAARNLAMVAAFILIVMVLVLVFLSKIMDRLIPAISRFLNEPEKEKVAKK